MNTPARTTSAAEEQLAKETRQTFVILLALIILAEIALLSWQLNQLSP